MIRDAARALWAEPRAPNPPAREWRDWALVGVLLPAVLAEGALHHDVAWRGLSIALLLAVLPLLLVRRTHAFASTLLVFGAISLTSVAGLVAGVYMEGLGIGVFVLLFPYALTRWASGREIAMGMPVVMTPVVLTAFDPVPIGDLIAGALVMCFAAALGLGVRSQDVSRQRGMDRVKLLEREQLARELHDTVAHHVSAIVIRAQAGRVVGASDPAAAIEALGVIEHEASRALTEMRAMVGALRQGEEADLAPNRGVADIQRLTTVAGQVPEVDVEVSGELDGLRPSVAAALYRLAQQSVTNAVQHARRATRIQVTVHGEPDAVRLTVADDGEAGGFDPRTAAGFGLIGMAERAKLLGGTLEAGPNRNKGWTVRAVLPKGQSSS